MEKIGWGSIISGGGTTMDAMAEQVVSGFIDTGERAIDCRIVIATKQDAGGIEKAQKRGLKVEVVNPKDYATPEEFGEALNGVLYDNGVDLVTLNGCLVRIPQNVVIEYTMPLEDLNTISPGRRAMFNQHPGPLPATAELYSRQPHVAMRVYRAVTDTGDLSEVVAHQVVSDQYDVGPIVGAAAFRMRSRQAPEEIQQTALPLEHGVQIQLLWDFARGTLREVQTIDMAMDAEQQQAMRLARYLARTIYPRG